MKAITELHATIDAISSALARATAYKGKPVTCQGKGCCACCYETVYCSSAEASHLLEGLTNEQRAAVTGRLRLALAQVRQSGLFDKYLPPVMDWLALKLPCPLLENSRCMAYENRPIGCRTHLACGPANWCVENRPRQIYPQAEEASRMQGQAILEAHLKLGNTVDHDNLLALLEKELLGEYHESASAHKIVFTEDNNDK